MEYNIYEVGKYIFNAIDSWCVSHEDIIAKKILPIVAVLAIVGMIILIVNRKNDA